MRSLKISESINQIHLMSNLIDFKNIPLSIREEKKILIDLDTKILNTN